MENESKKIEFFKFHNVGESLEGKVINFIQTQLGAAVETEIASNEMVYLGINTIGLKRIWKQAILNNDIVIGETVFSILFEDEIVLKKDAGKTFCHFILSGYKYKNSKETYFRYSTREYEVINKDKFLKFLE